MRVCFIYAEKVDGDQGREFILADNFLEGVRKSGDSISKIRKGEVGKRSTVEADVVCMVGVKSLKLFRHMRAEGKHVLYFDKGYFRHRGPTRTWEYWRIAVNDHHPTSYMAQATHTMRRWEAIASRRHVEIKPWRASDNVGPVVYAGSSEKYHEFAGLPEPTAYAEKIIKQIKKGTGRQVLYRPKPTWYDAVEIDGSQFSPRTASIQDALTGAWCLVTNGSNSSYDALLAGVPSIVLGNAIARPISSTSLDDLENPYICTNDERDQWLANLAWCMFTEDEMKEGIAWQAMKPQIYGQVIDETNLPFVAGKGMRPSKALLKKTGDWKKAKSKRTKEEQRKNKPFTKVTLAEFEGREK